MSVATVDSTSSGRVLRAGLWTAQVLIFVVFGLVGLTKLLTPISQLAQTMPWADDYSEAFVRAIALIDLIGALGILLPAVTRIKPGLTVLAALGCTVLQAFAIGFHISRGEAALTPFNFVLLALSAFVWWGRSRNVPIKPRT